MTTLLPVPMSARVVRFASFEVATVSNPGWLEGFYEQLYWPNPSLRRCRWGRICG
jgi:hypothetical protein